MKRQKQRIKRKRIISIDSKRAKRREREKMVGKKWCYSGEGGGEERERYRDSKVTYGQREIKM
jgi:hypothetical protein